MLHIVYKLLFYLILSKSVVIGQVVCNNVGFIDSETKTCVCPLGWTGTNCTETYCSNNGTENEKGNLCTCPEGTTGTLCEVCGSHASCNAGNLEGTCRNDNLDLANGNWSGSCTSDNQALGSLLGGSISVNLNTMNETKDSNLLSGSFQVFRETATDQTAAFSCAISQCKNIKDTFTDTCQAGSGPLQDVTNAFECQTMACSLTCEFGVGFCSPILNSALAGIAGPAQVACNNEGCKVSQTLLNVFAPCGLTLGCTFGQCSTVEKANATILPTIENTGSQSQTSSISEIIVYTSICAIVGLCLLSLLVGILAFGYIKYFLNSKWATINTTEFIDDADFHNISRGSKSLVFSDLGFSSKKVNYLDSVRGAVFAGEMMAIMGPSGAGKTTCLDILAGRAKKGHVKGTVIANGTKVKSGKLQKSTGFVEQEFVTIGTLTVMECLMYSALLRLPKSMPRSEKRRRVEEVMRNLKIDHIVDSKIGSNTKRGISGGEMRRLSIAVELVTSPKLLFLDEPTSSLDSYNAHVVISCLKTLAQAQNTCIVLTIHQPSSLIYRKFDKLLLLSKGKMMYFGQAQETALQYFNSIGVPACPSSVNVADYMMDTIMSAEVQSDKLKNEKYDGTLNGESSNAIKLHKIQPRRASPDKKSSDVSGQAATPLNGSVLCVQKTVSSIVSEGSMTSGEEHLFTVDQLHHAYMISNIYGETVNEVDGILNASKEPKQTEMLDLKKENEGGTRSSPGRASWLSQLLILSHRSLSNLFRDPTLIIGHWTVGAFVGLLLGLIYFDSGVGSIENGDVNNPSSSSIVATLQQQLGALLLVLAFLAFGGLTSLEVFYGEKFIYMREYANRFYGSTSYFISKLLFDTVILRVIPPVILGTILYFMMNMRHGVFHFLSFILTLILCNLAASSICLLIGMAISNRSVALLVSSLVMLWSLALTNIFNNSKLMPAWVAWLHYVSFFNYAFEALVINELEGLYIEGSVFGAAGLAVSSDDLIKEFGFELDMFWVDVLVLIAIFLVAQGITLALLKFKIKLKN